MPRPARHLLLISALIPLACGDRSGPNDDELAEASADAGTMTSSDGDASSSSESADASTGSTSEGTGSEDTVGSESASTDSSGESSASSDDTSASSDTSASETGSGDTSSEGGTTTTTTGGPPSFDACGFADDDGPWVEIEYWQLGSISSPSYTYSDTPGWGEAEWAAANMSWPEIWEFGGNSMSNDPIGIVASISGTWQMMIGLDGLVSYDHATVCVEGRSISVGSDAIFDVYNPANGCGFEAQISNTWDVHAVGVDLGDCLIPGAETQAVRIEPTGGSGVVGLVRVRVSLHGAVY